MAKEYIEREALIEFIRPYTHEDVLLEPIDVINDIKAIPAADVVEVVRCKDCQWSVVDLRESGAHFCMRVRNGFPLREKVKLDDFCSRGIRIPGCGADMRERRDNIPEMGNWSPATKKLYDDVMESLTREDGDNDVVD